MDFGIKARKDQKEKRYKADNFLKHCGFVPVSKPNSVLPWEQQIVDELLAILAEKFDSADKTQRKAMGTPKLSVLGEGWKTRINFFREVNDLVDKTKSMFWTAHNAAKEYGFAVRDKYSDYL